VRIELGELEGVLRQLPGVQAAAAQARPGPGGLARLVAYVVAPESRQTDALQAELEQRLPLHLLPSHIVRLERLPLLPSGKLNRTALPEPEWQSESYVAPTSALQRQLAALWQEILGAERPGLGDDFFALGGHSLLATQVVSRVRKAFDVELPLRDLFEARRLGDFAERVQAALDSGRRNRQPALTRVDRSRPLPLSYSQERMWFLWSLEPESSG
jgi:acyl carrier protein